MRGNPLLSRSNTGDCIAAVMLNAVRDVKVGDVSKAVTESMGDVVDSFLRFFSVWVARLLL